jgi:hypothetical protein
MAIAGDNVLINTDVMTETVCYWCPRWYPASPDEMPCDRFFTTGIYLLDVNAHDMELEPAWEGDPDEVACREHEADPERVTASEWDARLGRARKLGEARGWVVPEPEEWNDRGAIGVVVSTTGEQCSAPSSGYGSRCGRAVLLVGVERDGKTYEKLVCQGAREAATREWGRHALRDFEQTAHVNRCLPWLPPNH